MIKFSPRGPLAVPVYQGTNGRIIRAAEAAQFWSSQAALATERGVYVFGIRSGGGVVPTYAGQATVTFEQEVFTHHKLAAHYNVTLVDYQKGTPVLFFLVYPAGGVGAPNLAAIDDLETAMIAEVTRVNPGGVTNTKKKPAPPTWAINGVVRAPGQPSASAREFATLLKL